MSDIPPEATELAKLGGTGVGGGVVTLMLAKWLGFGGNSSDHDKAVIARLDQMNAAIAALSQQFAVMAAGGERSAKDMADVRAEQRALRDELHARDQRLVRLEALVERLSEGGP